MAIKIKQALKEAWNLISGYVTRSESLEPVNEQQIIDAYETGDKYKFEISAEKWFNETFEKS